jgi:hypothetical protein
MGASKVKRPKRVQTSRLATIAIAYPIAIASTSTRTNYQINHDEARNYQTNLSFNQYRTLPERILNSDF